MGHAFYKLYLFAKTNKMCRTGGLLMEYISAKDAAERWGITKRRVQILCAKKRIEGVYRLGNTWAIPADSVKPLDGRKSERKDDLNG